MTSQKTQRLKLLINLLMIFLTISTTAIPAISQNQPTIILEKGEKAPFEGILLSEEVSRKMRADIYARDEFQSDLQRCLEEKKELIPEKSSNALFFATGTALGLVVSLLIGKN